MPPRAKSPKAKSPKVAPGMTARNATAVGVGVGALGAAAGYAAKRAWDAGRTASLKFPARWGPPPEAQTADLIELPGGYGMGSTTLSRWITSKLKEDAAGYGPIGAYGCAPEYSDATGRCLGASDDHSPPDENHHENWGIVIGAIAVLSAWALYRRRSPRKSAEASTTAAERQANRQKFVDILWGRY